MSGRNGAALLMILAALVMTGCSSEPGTVGEKSSPQFRSLGTAPPGGAFFVVGSALTEVLNEAGPTAGWQFAAEATKGSQENIRRLVRGELDFALSNSSITYFAVRGQGEWEAPQEVQAVMTMAPNVALFLVPAGSSIRSLRDLIGNRVVIGPAGAGFEYFVEPLLMAHGVRLEDLTPLYNTQAAAVDMLADGSAASAFLGGAVPTASIAQASTSMDIRFLPFEPEAREALIRDYPFFEAASIPAGTYRGQDEAFEGLNVGSMHLIAPAAMDEQVVYDVTRYLYENREKVIQRHAAGRSLTPGNVARNTGTPFHAGAVRFYREIGIWPDSESGSAN